MTADKLVLPKITVVTPSYNQAEFLEETIQSVLGQSYPDLEYLVYDAGSSDGSIEILRRYNDQLSWVSQKDRGQSDALNQGFRRASGDILAFLNSDDRYEPGALLKVGKFFASHPDAHWLSGKCRVIDTDGNKIRRAVTAYKNFWLSWKSRTVLLVLDYVSQPATFWRRTVFEKIGGFDEDLHYSMDYDYSLRASLNFRLWSLDQYLAAYRIHPASKSGSVRKHFATDLAIAGRYTKSRLLLALHAFHNYLIIKLYERWQNPTER